MSSCDVSSSSGAIRRCAIMPLSYRLAASAARVLRQARLRATRRLAHRRQLGVRALLRAPQAHRAHDAADAAAEAQDADGGADDGEELQLVGRSLVGELEARSEERRVG